MLTSGPINQGRLAEFRSRHPLFVAALVASAGVVAADRSMTAAVIVGLLVAIVGYRAGGWKTGVFWIFCAWFSAAGYLLRNDGRVTAERVLLDFPGGEIQGKALEDATGSERFWSAPVVLASGPRPGARVWWEGRGELPVAGSWVKSQGNFAPLHEPRNPGDFDQAEWLRLQGFAAAFQASWVDGKVWTGKWAARAAGVRSGFRTSVTDGLGEDSREAMVIRAVVIGEKPPEAEELVAAFRNSGTLHAFPV